MAASPSDKLHPERLSRAKQAMRDAVRTRSASVAPADAEAAGRVALGHLERDTRWGAARNVGLFAATTHEPATRDIFESVLVSGRTALFPRCISNTEMEFAPASGWAELEPGRYGLLEPTATTFGEPWQEGDLVLMPGVAFDAHGGRLGHGAGFYDRYFGGRVVGAPRLLGFGFSFQFESEVPMGEHDRRLDGVLSETGLVWLDRGGER